MERSVKERCGVTLKSDDQLVGYDELLGQVLEAAPRVGRLLSRAHRNRTQELNRYLNADIV